MGKRWRVALVGCGGIARGHYLPEIQALPNAEIIAVCDAVPGRAEECATQFGVDKSYTDVDAMLRDCDFEILVDVAAIQGHFEINLKALRAGKHLYSQKPIALTTEEAAQLIDEADNRGLKISASPIHMLRPDIQEARRIIQDGVIGKISLVRCSSSHGGPEYFQYRDADPSWFHEPGAGPLFDLGVHGLHQVTGLLGPATSVTCLSGISEKVRTARSGAFDGEQIQTRTDDNVLLLLDFGEATFAFIDSTYCVKSSKSPRMEVFGSKGTITFMSNARERRFELFLDEPDRGVRGWMEPVYRWSKISQSQGVKDLIAAVEEEREPVLSARHALHVIEIMQKAPEAAREGRSITLESRFGSRHDRSDLPKAQ